MILKNATSYLKKAYFRLDVVSVIRMGEYSMYLQPTGDILTRLD